MDAITGLPNQLRALAQGARHEGPTLTAALTALEASLVDAVPSYLGLQLTLTSNGYPVVLTAGYAAPTVTTSLRFPLGLISAKCRTGSTIVFFAATPEAFIDLDTDLRRAFGGTNRAIVLDGDLPPSSHPAGLSGDTQLAEINRAVGVLIEHGIDPGEAHDTLRRHAATAGMQPYAYALEVLREAGPSDT